MDSKNIIISFIYYIGIASCAAQGAEKGKDKTNIPILHYIVNAFGGGFIRDVVILKIQPLLLTLSALPDIILTILSGFLYTYCFFIYKKNKNLYNITKRLVTITDMFGVSSFISIGMDRAFNYNNNIFTIIICGYVTAIGGGILASGKPLTKIFKSKETVYYHLITLLGCCYYYIFRHSLYLICFIIIEFFLINIDYKSLYSHYLCNLITPCCKIFFLYPAIHNKNNTFQKPKIINITKKLNTCLEHPKIYLIQQRIRQC